MCLSRPSTPPPPSISMFTYPACSKRFAIAQDRSNFGESKYTSIKSGVNKASMAESHRTCQNRGKQRRTSAQLPDGQAGDGGVRLRTHGYRCVENVARQRVGSAASTDGKGSVLLAFGRTPPRLRQPLLHRSTEPRGPRVSNFLASATFELS
jgi:hypothetical protein